MKNIKITNKQLHYLLNENVYSYKDKLKLIKDKNIKDGGNFPIERNGKMYWVSRSNTISMRVFCKNPQGEWCVLASKRGPTQAVHPNCWNVVCGYLDYGYSLEDTCVNECWEETGVKIDKSMLHYDGTNSNRVNSDVCSYYHVVLNGTTEDYPTSIDNCEPGEVTDARWVPLSMVDKLHWMGRQGQTNLELAEKYLSDDELAENKEYGIIKNALNSLMEKKLIDGESVNQIMMILNKKEEI